MRSVRRAVLRAVLVAVAAGACTDSTPTGLGFDFYAARSRWRARHPDSYAYTLERSCFCGHLVTSPVVIEVIGDAVQSRRYVETGAPVDPGLADAFPPIDGLFEIIENAARNGAAQLDVTYDPALGFPTQIAIDGRTNIADDEVTYRARNFAAR
jgi:hypothetical protein